MLLGAATPRRPTSARSRVAVVPRPPWDDRVHAASQAEAPSFVTGQSGAAVLRTHHLEERRDGYDSLRDRGMQPYFVHNRTTLRHLQDIGFVSQALHVVPHADRKLKMLDLAFQEMEREQRARDGDVHRALTIRLAMERREHEARARRAACQSKYVAERRRREDFARRMCGFESPARATPENAPDAVAALMLADAPSSARRGRRIT